jgi:hypothetical protein
MAGSSRDGRAKTKYTVRHKTLTLKKILRFPQGEPASELEEQEIEKFG